MEAGKTTVKGSILTGQIRYDEKLSKNTIDRDGEDTNIQEAKSGREGEGRVKDDSRLYSLVGYVIIGQG